ncbi:HNH endonuclease signature motif containing protein [Mycolicibacterium novocastrense]|uniref:HNH endonuclease signature motif containing protein n=1 Tax=Mycolicibacterium novocastrense TaxID=59813 RepID=UPI000AE03DFD|nr:HNH endonuclease signature motif containing protein [Mycolicibacterium novocastrense]
MSDPGGILEHMFGSEFAGADDRSVVAAIEECARTEAVWAARRLAAVAELTARYTEPDEDRDHFAVDGWRMASAEISAAMGVGDRAASGQMCIAMALRERLPKVAALFVRGQLSAGLVSTITWRTQLIVDSAVAARVDAAIAERAGQWGVLSVARLEAAIDAVVDQYDPDARRRLRQAAQNRDVRVGKRDDVTGTMSLWGRLSTTDGVLLERRLAQMISQVCPDDPRTLGQRRSEALGAIAAGAQGLPCRCGSPQCPSAGHDDARAAHFLINIIAEAATAAAAHAQTAQAQTQPPPAQTQPAPAQSEPASAPAEAAERPPDATAAQPTPATEPAATGPEPKTAAQSPAALIIGGGVIPTPLLAELIGQGAKVQPVHPPPAAPGAGYRPSPTTARFVRMRDMTCRFPGCDRPAEFCDFDHTTPYPAGATHPSNIKCLCRIHHLLKTFGGWSDQQHPDGTVQWTAPTGRTYLTHPGSRLFYPDWDTTTATVPTNSPPAARGDKAAMMPRRRRTRAQDRLHRITRERALNALDRAKTTAPATTAPSRPPPTHDDTWNTTSDADINTTDTEPPPF